MKIAMLISGGGTTMASIITAVKEGRLKNVEPVLVISSNPEAAGIEKALNLGISKEDIVVIRRKDFPSLEEFGKKIIEECKKRQVEFVGQYGWLPLTPSNVIKEYEGKIINQHPVPLDPGRPDFGGKGMWGKQAVCARLLFVKKTGRDFWNETIAHRVTKDYDMGAVVKAFRVPIFPDDTVDSLYNTRIFPMEYVTQIQTLQDFADGTVREIIFKEPLIRPEEYEILEQCKKEAIEKYSH